MPSKKNKKRPTIGFTITNLHNKYSIELWNGVVDTAEKNDINVVMYRGESLNTPIRHNYQSNVIYDLINNEYIDVLIMATGTLCNYISHEDFTSYCKRFKKIPTISISIELPGIPSILVDNKAGMRDAVNHLIQKHNYKNIAFIRGPKNNNEAEERYNVFVETMKANNLKVNENLITVGNFIEYSGKNSIIELLDKRKVHFDAIIACNDEMAFGALKELKRRNIKIPDEAALIGFDNIEECEYNLPSITSVNQPLYQQGKTAVDFAMKIINNEKPPDKIILPTNLAVRASCGCTNILTKKNKEIDLSEEKIINKIKELAKYEKYIQINNSDISKITKSILEMAEKNHSSKDFENKFIEYINELLVKFNFNEKNSSFWEKAFNILFDYILLNIDDKSIRKIESLFHKVFLNLEKFIKIRHGINRINIESRESELRRIIEEIESSLYLEELIENEVKQLPQLKINSCYIVSYGMIITHYKHKNFHIPMNGELLLAYKDGKVIKTNNKNSIFLTKKFIPQKLLPDNRRYTLIVYPFYYLEEQYGYLAYELGERDPNVYDLLALVTSSTYRSTILLAERKKSEDKLRKVLEELKIINTRLYHLSEKDELTGLYNRRGFIKLAEKSKDLSSEMQEDGMIFYIDLDELKKINDTYGHNEGDEAIKAAAKIIKKSFRNMDIISRLGGDEFTVCTVNINKNFINNIINRINNNIVKYNENSSKPYNINLSIGYVIFDYMDTSTIPELMKIADNNLYIEKRKKKEKKSN